MGLHLVSGCAPKPAGPAAELELTALPMAWVLVKPPPLLTVLTLCCPHVVTLGAAGHNVEGFHLSITSHPELFILWAQHHPAPPFRLSYRLGPEGTNL